MGRKGSSTYPSTRERGLNLTSQAGGVQSVLLQVAWMHEDPPGLCSLLPDLQFMGLPVTLAAAPQSHSL